MWLGRNAVPALWQKRVVSVFNGSWNMGQPIRGKRRQTLKRSCQAILLLMATTYVKRRSLRSRLATSSVSVLKSTNSRQQQHQQQQQQHLWCYLSPPIRMAKCLSPTFRTCPKCSPEYSIKCLGTNNFPFFTSSLKHTEPS
jgi:hypothetical protein